MNDDNKKNKVRTLPEAVKEETRKLYKHRGTRHLLERSSVLLMDELRLFQAKLRFLVNVRKKMGSEGKKVHKIV